MGEVGAGCLVTSGLLSSTPTRLLGSHRNSRMLELERKAETLTQSLPLTNEEIEVWDTVQSHTATELASDRDSLLAGQSFLNSLRSLSLSQHCRKGNFTQNEEIGGKWLVVPGGAPTTV